ncbi:MAG: hypothetical protein IJO32_01345 [Bacilli bacterium]|nr:hypothetical protein [Bacilli bacterium]
MNISKNELRNKLFEKYFEINDGVTLSNLMDLLKPNIETFKNFRQLLMNNTREFKWFQTLKRINTIEHNQRKYLIIEIGLGKYIIVDLLKEQILTKKHIPSKFEKEILMNKDNYCDIYHYLKYEGDIQGLIKYYNDNQEILNSKKEINYKINIGEAYTYLYIDLANSKIQLGFQTPDQFLYERLFFNIDLTPFCMQDAQEKIGIEKMNEIFDRIKNIRIPKELYEDNAVIKEKQKVLKKDTVI